MQGHDPEQVRVVGNRYLPAGHDLHTDDPETTWYVPGSHQVHVLSDVAPVTLLYFPTSHWLHTAAVNVSLKDPGAHGVQYDTLSSPA